MKPVKTKPDYKRLLADIGFAIKTARLNAVKAINTQLVKANWEIGRHIVEFEQQGQERAEYGSALLTKLSKDLKLQYGKGFGRRNILDMRRFYLAYGKWQAAPAKLSWTHIITLLAITDDTTRKFYEKQTVHENWSYMNLYLNYFKTEENVEGDGAPIGIILSAEKDEVMVEYAMGGISNKIFVSKYQLYLPDKKLLQKEVKAIMDSNKKK